MLAKKFTLKIDTQNAAFDDDAELEVARLLRSIANRLEAGNYDGRIKDYNGNDVGSFNLK